MSKKQRIVASIALAGALGFAGVGCGSSGSSASFCDTLKANSKVISSADFSSKDAMNKASDVLNQLKSSAPSEIKSDVELLADAINKLKDVDLKDPASAAKVMKDFDQKKLETASDNVEKYAKDTCKIDMGS